MSRKKNHSALRVLCWLYAKAYPPKQGIPLMLFEDYGIYARYLPKRTILYTLLCSCMNYFGIPRYRYGAWKAFYPDEKKAAEVGIEKQLERAGYVQHTEYWQKGFVRAAIEDGSWNVWHAMTGNKTKVCTTPQHLFDTLKYMERI